MKNYRVVHAFVHAGLTGKEAKFEAAKRFWSEIEAGFRKDAPPRADQDMR